MNAVVMHAGLQGLLVGSVAGVLLEGGRTGCMPDGVAPRQQHVCGIAIGYAHRIAHRQRNAAKPDDALAFQAARGATRKRQGQAAEHRQRCRAFQQSAARQPGRQHFVKRGVRGGVDDFLIAVAVAHGGSG